MRLLLALSLELLIQGCFSDISPSTKQEPGREETQKAPEVDLHAKYSPLLKKAREKVESKLFDKIRWRCDDQVMPWIENALDSLQNNVPYTAKGAYGGMSKITTVPKTPKEMIMMMVNETQVCGIPDYIKRVESVLDPKDNELKAFINDMKNMLSELREIK